MEFYNKLYNLDMTRENIAVTILTGASIGDKLLLSDKEKIYTTNENSDWNEVIAQIPENKKSQTITVGKEKIYYEFMRQSFNVVICGAGHISMPLIKMCKMLALPVTVIDDRITFTNNARREGADKVICESFVDALRKVEGDTGTFFIIVTRGHRYDQECLQSIIQKENAYIGMIGSKLRVKKVLEYLESEGTPKEKLDAVYTPIGLKIGAETPAEIAVSIMAQVIEVKNKKAGAGTYPEELRNCLFSEKHRDIPKSLVTLVSRKGSAPREVGTKMIILKDGNTEGTIGGGCVEANIRQTALSCMDNMESRLVKVDMTGIEAEEEGMVCGGIVELFVEPIINI
ncbi:XdhC family protein [Sedimentibacter hydroxybenzoicus DSM 7310]|uniref:XdhC family protein n=1 Tax=Sedimentibacter hydroxybenzoicus DSM 7310 TaxID=1123245 RepID=A0A974BKR8_SEDHY|nr:XdhC/CoxI family protein [Sedimentibacter hydroxybenzoicus]NYB75134.1 XdhC family protein [Sedimentibacter hydroxybenzoicus DSM 7310]